MTTPHKAVTGSSYPIRPPQTNVLALLYPDGHVEVRGRRHVSAAIFNVPEAYDAESEQWAERFLDLTLPRWARELYYPSHILAIGNVERVTADELLRRRQAVKFCQKLDAIATAWPAASKEVIIC